MAPTAQAVCRHPKTEIVGGSREVGRGESLVQCQTLGLILHLVHSGGTFRECKQGNAMVTERVFKDNFG